MNREELDNLLLGQKCVLVPRTPYSKGVIPDFDLKSTFEGIKKPSTSDITRWRKEGFDRAIVLGTPSENLVCIDADGIKDAISFFGSKENYSRMYAGTFSTITSRGVQFLFRDPDAKLDKLPTSIQDKEKLNLEFLIHHRLAATPLNKHENRTFTYGWNQAKTIFSKSGIVEQFLSRFEDFKISTRRTSKLKISGIINGVKEGSRNESAYRYCRYLTFNVKLDADTMLFEMDRWNQQNKPPLPELELQNVIHSAVSTQPKRTSVEIRSKRIL